MNILHESDGSREKCTTVLDREEGGGLIPVKVDVPVVLGRERAHGLEEVALRVIALLGGGADVGRVRVGALRESRETPGEEGWSHGHSC